MGTGEPIITLNFPRKMGAGWGPWAVSWTQAWNDALTSCVARFPGSVLAGAGGWPGLQPDTQPYLLGEYLPSFPCKPELVLSLASWEALWGSWSGKRLRSPQSTVPTDVCQPEGASAGGAGGPGVGAYICPPPSSQVISGAKQVRAN